MQNYVHEGKPSRSPRPIPSTPVGASRWETSSASRCTTPGASLEIVTEGVFDLAKDTSTFTSGDAVYWDDTNKVATSTAAGNLVIGTAELAQASGTAALGGARATLRFASG